MVTLSIHEMTGTSQQANAADVSGESVAPERSKLRRKVAAYISLTKPRIIELLLVTTLPTMFLAAGGLFSPWLALGVIFLVVYAVALVTTLAPALRASRVYPAEALRYQ